MDEASGGAEEDRGCDRAPPSKRKLRAKQHFHLPRLFVIIPDTLGAVVSATFEAVLLMASTSGRKSAKRADNCGFRYFSGLGQRPGENAHRHRIPNLYRLDPEFLLTNCSSSTSPRSFSANGGIQVFASSSSLRFFRRLPRSGSSVTGD